MLSVIIPAYNEEKRIVRTLKPTISFLSEQPYESEIIVVCDGCTDSTRQAAESFSGEFKNLRIIDYTPNRGKGYAVKQGMLGASGELRLFMDADYAVPIELITGFIEKISKGNDIVIASRRHKDSVIEKHQMFLRELAGKGFGLFQVLVLGFPYFDTHCGFKLYTAKAAEYLFHEIKYDCNFFDPEAMYIAYKAKMKVAEMPVVWRHDGDTRIPVGPSKTLDITKKLFRIKGNHKVITKWNGENVNRKV